MSPGKSFFNMICSLEHPKTYFKRTKNKNFEFGKPGLEPENLNFEARYPSPKSQARARARKSGFRSPSPSPIPEPEKPDPSPSPIPRPDFWVGARARYMSIGFRIWNFSIIRKLQLLHKFQLLQQYSQQYQNEKKTICSFKGHKIYQ